MDAWEPAVRAPARLCEVVRAGRPGRSFKGPGRGHAGLQARRRPARDPVRSPGTRPPPAEPHTSSHVLCIVEVNEPLRLPWINLGRGCNFFTWRQGVFGKPRVHDLHRCLRAQGRDRILFPLPKEPQLPPALPKATAPGGGGLKADFLPPGARCSVPPAILLFPKSELGRLGGAVG